MEEKNKSIKILRYASIKDYCSSYSYSKASINALMMRREGVLSKHTFLYFIWWSGSEHYCNLQAYDYSMKYGVPFAKKKTNVTYRFEMTSYHREGKVRANTILFMQNSEML